MTEVTSVTTVNPEDFSEAEHAMVDQMAAPMLQHFAGERKANRKFNSRNRYNWNRMNAPERTAKIDKGSDIIHRLIDKGIALNGFSGV